MMELMPRLAAGPQAVIECSQNIPCNPCADACPRGAIRAMEDINECPVLDTERCNGCGLCLVHCPGLAIFIVDYNYAPDKALVKIPYEFLPLPEAGWTVDAIDRAGHKVGEAHVLRVQDSKNKTRIIWLTVPSALAMEVRHIRVREE